MMLVLITLVTIIPASPVQGRDSVAECSRVSLTSQPQRPQWISSAVWVEDKREIAAVDTLKNRINLLSPEGEIRVAEVFPKASPNFLPAELVKGPNGYLLKMVGLPPQVLQLDQNLEPRQLNDLAKKSIPDGVRSVYQWISANGDLVGYGTVSRSGQGKSYRAGFFRTPLELNTAADLLFPYDDGDYYVLGHQYLASLGSTAYFVLMDQTPLIFEAPHGKKARALKAFPSDYRRAPKFKTSMAGPSDAEPLFREVEELTIPVGLYGQDKMLYLLTRRPGEKGTTVWSLFQIDVQNDRISGELRLPTSVHHLTVVPSHGSWFFLEKGPVQGMGTQELYSILSIPTNWISSPSTSPLNAQRLKVKTCGTPNK
jgi:hypothetical protein